MKEHILKLIELKPNIGYYELSMTFGLSLKELLELLDIKEYKIEDNYIGFYDNNGNKTYYEHSDGSWIKREHDKNDNIIYYEDSNGFWIKWEYDENGNVIYFEDSDGNKINY